MAHYSTNEPSRVITGPDGVSLEIVKQGSILLSSIKKKKIKEEHADWLIENLESLLGQTTHLFFDLCEAENYEPMAQIGMAGWLLKQKKKTKLKGIEAHTKSELIILGVQPINYLLGGPKIQIHSTCQSFDTALAQAKNTAMGAVIRE